MECFSKIKLNKKENKTIPEDIFKQIMNKNCELNKWWNYHHMFYTYDNHETIEIYFKLHNMCSNYDYHDEECKSCELNARIIEKIEIKYNNKLYVTNDKYQMTHLYNKFRHKNNFSRYYIN